jgi:hypothetical protein
VGNGNDSGTLTAFAGHLYEDLAFFVARQTVCVIGGWRTRSVFERYAIVSRSDMNDAILKLEGSEKRAEQERTQKEEQENQTQAQNGHTETILEQPTASRAVN